MVEAVTVPCNLRGDLYVDSGSSLVLMVEAEANISLDAVIALSNLRCFISRPMALTFRRLGAMRSCLVERSSQLDRHQIVQTGSPCLFPLPAGVAASDEGSVPSRGEKVNHGSSNCRLRFLGLRVRR